MWKKVENNHENTAKRPAKNREQPGTPVTDIATKAVVETPELEGEESKPNLHHQLKSCQTQ